MKRINEDRSPKASRAPWGSWLLLAATLAALTPTACVVFPAKLDSGEAISTGKTPYDEFFIEVRDLVLEAEKGASARLVARAELEEALGVEANASEEKTLEKMQGRADELRKKGVLLHLDVAPEPELVIAKKGFVDASTDRLLRSIQTSARNSLALSKRLAKLEKLAETLAQTQSKLKSDLWEAFKTEPSARRGEVSRELDAAERLIARARETSASNSGLSSKFVIDLAFAVETGAGTRGHALAEKKSEASSAEPAPPPAKPKSTWKPPPKPAGQPASKPPSKPAAQPAAKPPAPPAGKPKDDFDP